jgi:flagellar biosynthesis anti-sigma factor FlgM
MTNSIGSLPQNQAATDVASQKTDAASPKSQAAPAQGSGANEAVTISDAATVSTNLLAAARSSDGIDHAAVQRLSSAIQNGTYNVSPDDLAGAMIGAAKARSS